MNPELLLLLTEKNGADITAIVNAIGVETLLKLAPHFINIIKTLQGQQPKDAGS